MASTGEGSTILTIGRVVIETLGLTVGAFRSFFFDAMPLRTDCSANHILSGGRPDGPDLRLLPRRRKGAFIPVVHAGTPIIRVPTHQPWVPVKALPCGMIKASCQ